jgi:hypothetical protein
MEGEEHGTYIQYIVDRADDGTFRANIRSIVSCETSPAVLETGRWEFRDGTLYNRTETVEGHAVDAADAYYQDAFVVTFVDDDHVTAFDVKTQITWQSRRVDDAFMFPPALICTF